MTTAGVVSDFNGNVVILADSILTVEGMPSEGPTELPSGLQVSPGDFGSRMFMGGFLKVAKVADHLAMAFSGRVSHILEIMDLLREFAATAESSTENYEGFKAFLADKVAPLASIDRERVEYVGAFLRPGTRPMMFGFDGGGFSENDTPGNMKFVGKGWKRFSDLWRGRRAGPGYDYDLVTKLTILGDELFAREATGETSWLDTEMTGGIFCCLSAGGPGVRFEWAPPRTIALFTTHAVRLDEQGERLLDPGLTAIYEMREIGGAITVSRVLEGRDPAIFGLINPFTHQHPHDIRNEVAARPVEFEADLLNAIYLYDGGFQGHRSEIETRLSLVRLPVRPGTSHPSPH